ncbi:MAG: hypothetical protein FWC43_06865 [Planctomycetaceae bacterium]|nr:hypothetical protein [Planctomycetaceae bacterium]
MQTLTIELLNPKARNILDSLKEAGFIAIGEPLKPRRIMELKGLGAEIWKDENADEYLRKEREYFESWSE